MLIPYLAQVHQVLERLSIMAINPSREVSRLTGFQMEYNVSYPLLESTPSLLREKISAYQDLQQLEPTYTIFQKMIMVILLTLVVSFTLQNNRD